TEEPAPPRPRTARGLVGKVMSSQLRFARKPVARGDLEKRSRKRGDRKILRDLLSTSPRPPRETPFKPQAPQSDGQPSRLLSVHAFVVDDTRSPRCGSSGASSALRFRPMDLDETHAGHARKVAVQGPNRGMLVSRDGGDQE